MPTNPTDPFDGVEVAVMYCTNCDTWDCIRPSHQGKREPLASISAMRRAVVEWLRGKSKHQHELAEITFVGSSKRYRRQIRAEAYYLLADQLERGGHDEG